MTASTAIEREGRVENVPVLRAFVDDACRAASLPDEVRFALKLAVDEACSNIVEHGYAGMHPGPITVVFQYDRERASVTISDRGRHFDPAALPAPDLAASWRDRRPGGLGWHLIRNVVDETSYAADATGANVLRLVKRLVPIPTPP